MKPSLLLLHGALGSKKQFRTIIPLLTDIYDVYSFNFEGHGGIATNKAYSMAVFVENTLQFIKENNLEGTAVFGYSMGGYVALNLVLKHPKMIGKIVTLGTKFNWDKITTEKEVRMLNPEKIKEKVPHYASHLAQEHAPLDWEVVMKNTAEMMLGLSKGSRLKNNQFSQITNPVVIGLGTKDKMVSYEESAQVSKLLPNGIIQKANGFAHPINTINPEELALFIINAL